MKIEDALELFLSARRASGRSERTIVWYDQQLRRFIAWLQEHEINGSTWLRPEIIERFLAAERETDLSPSTVAARYRALSAWFAWLKQRGYLGDLASPVLSIERPSAPKPVVEHVTPAEFRQFYNSISGDDWLDWRDRVIALVLFWSGLRVAELCALSLADVDTNTGIIVVRRGKGGDPRVVPCTPDLRPVLLSYLFHRPPWAKPQLLLSSDGYGGVRGLLTTEGVRQMMRRRCREAGMRHLNPHAWRHGFAMGFLNAGAEMSSVSAMMGHSSVKVTEDVYAHWLTEGLKREYDSVLKKLQQKTRNE